MGFYITPVAEPESPTRVSRARAQRITAAEFRFVAGSDPTELGLARVTNWTQGRRVWIKSDPNRAYRFEPTVRDELAWVLVFDDVPMPTLGGPLPTEDDPGPFVRPGSGTSDFMVWIDAATGRYLRAGSLHRSMSTEAPYNYKAMGRKVNGHLPTPEPHPCDTPEGVRIC
jgi:hypothetical protein